LQATTLFGFRPWVRRAGLSIVIVACAATVALAIAPRFGWPAERALWAYVVLLWIGGLKVFIGTFRPIVELDEMTIRLRPLHQFATRAIAWSDISGTEQMIGGDRLIVYFDTPRGMRFVALNLNLIKGRRDFLTMLDARLLAMDFRERLVERSRYLTRAAKLPAA
jgi:hypothetical protein